AAAGNHRMNKFVWAILIAAVAESQALVSAEPIQVKPGKGEFVFVDERGDARKQLTVYSYLPENGDPRTLPILFAMHGHHKSAKGYRNDWAHHADKYGFMVFAPLFDEEQWG